MIVDTHPMALLREVLSCAAVVFMLLSDRIALVIVSCPLPLSLSIFLWPTLHSFITPITFLVRQLISASQSNKLNVALVSLELHSSDYVLLLVLLPLPYLPTG